MTDLGAAVVGCRAVAPLHARGFVRADGARLVAVCDRDPEAASTLAGEFGVDAVTDYEQILRRDDIQIVSLVTPDELHAPMAIAAAQAGKHVLVEKPFAMTLAELDTMVAAAESAGVTMMCAQSLRYRPKLRAIRDAIRTGVCPYEQSIQPVLDAREVGAGGLRCQTWAGVVAHAQRHAPVRLPVDVVRELDQ